MFGCELAPVARRAPRPVVRAAPVPVQERTADEPRQTRRVLVAERTLEDVDRQAADHLRGHWGVFLDGLQSELHELRALCEEAEPGPDADAAYDHYRAHLGVMEWAARQVHRHYLDDLRRVTVDWRWDRGDKTGE